MSSSIHFFPIKNHFKSRDGELCQLPCSSEDAHLATIFQLYLHIQTMYLETRKEMLLYDDVGVPSPLYAAIIINE